MDITELKQMRRNLDRFLRRFSSCIKTKPSREHLRTYVRGQVSDLERKSVEPIALEAGVPPRTLQKFLAAQRRDEAAVAQQHLRIVLRCPGAENATRDSHEHG